MTFDPRITIVTLGVTDINRSVDFYQKLGFKRSSDSNDQVAFFKLRGTVLGLFGREALAKDAGVDYAEAAFSGVTLAHNMPSEKQVDEAYAFAVSCGATAVKPPEKVFWGGYSGYFSDPDGHLWEIAFNPFMPLAEDGHMQLND